MKLSWLLLTGFVLHALSGSATGQVPFRVVKKGTQFGQIYGSSLANVGDLNGDGVNDIAVGASGSKKPGSGSAEGAVEILSGTDGNLIWGRWGERQGDFFGTAITGGFDSNQDGVKDVVIGAPYYDLLTFNEGRVYLVDGKTKKVMGTLDGPSTSSLYGSALATIDDVDGDGVADFLVGAPLASFVFGTEGYVEVISGRDLTVIRTHSGVNLGDNMGQALTALGDVDHDEIGDYAISTPGYDGRGLNRGAVDVFSGATGIRLARFTGKHNVGLYGKSIAGMSTQDELHQELLFIGAPNSPSIGPLAGLVEVVSLSTMSVIQTLMPRTSFSRFGYNVANGGDLNGDGLQDLLVGATSDNAGGVLSGSVSIFSGNGFFSIGKFPGIPGSSLGQAIVGMGDTNGDGLGEFAMGSFEFITASLQGSMAIVSYMGVSKLPVPTPLLGLVWVSGSNLGHPQETQGALVASGPPGTVCVFGTSLELGGAVGPIFLDPNSTFFRQFFTMPPVGSRVFPLDLRQPSIAGTILTAQVLTWPSLTGLSPAINLLLGQ